MWLRRSIAPQSQRIFPSRGKKRFRYSPIGAWERMALVILEISVTLSPLECWSQGPPLRCNGCRAPRLLCLGCSSRKLLPRYEDRENKLSQICKTFLVVSTRAHAREVAGVTPSGTFRSVARL